MTISSRAAGLLAAGLCLASPPAFAHAHLLSAVPAENGTVTSAPTELRLTFSEGVNPKFTGATVTAPGGKSVATGDGKLDAGSDTTLVIPVTAPLAAGSYLVDWHALATDGHKTHGRYGFTLKP